MCRQARQWALPDDTDAPAHSSDTPYSIARVARSRYANPSRDNSGAVVVTNPRLPLVRLGGYWGSGIFCRVIVACHCLSSPTRRGVVNVSVVFSQNLNYRKFVVSNSIAFINYVRLALQFIVSAVSVSVS